MYWWFDSYMELMVKVYFTPFFIMGSADNVLDLFKPQTYNICNL